MTCNHNHLNRQEGPLHPSGKEYRCTECNDFFYVTLEPIIIGVSIGPHGQMHVEKNQDGLRRFAEALSRAYVKYFWLFGHEPHGTIQQMMAMLELCPEAIEYVQLYDQSRERSLTE